MFAGLEHLDTRQACEEGAWLQLKHPATFEPLVIDGKPLRLLLAGPDSALRQECLNELNRRVLRATQQAPEGKLPPKERWRIEAECMAPAVLGWEGFSEDYIRANVERLYTEHRWAFEQADNFSAVRAGFLPKPAGDSPPQSPGE